MADVDAQGLLDNDARVAEEFDAKKRVAQVTTPAQATAAE
jgi:hypothetical protein